MPSKLVLAATASMAALTASAALASGPVTVAPPEVVYTPAAPVRDWSGAYGGLSYSTISGAITENVFSPLTTPDFDNTTGAGVFAGYNWQRGNFVFGGEVSFINFDSQYIGFVNHQQDALELRGRAGYAFDSVLVYGFLGAARSTITSGLTDFTMDGYSFGVGLQALVTDHVFVGAEIARRTVNFTNAFNDITTDIDTISLRVGYQF